MKKSLYINKYDYIAYYTKQPNMWFFSNAEIAAALRYYDSAYVMFYDDEYEDELNDCLLESDLNTYKENKILDSLENNLEINQKYSDIYLELKDLDKNSPNIYQGLIIDKKSKEFIKKSYSSIKKIIDFDEFEYKTLEEQFNLTINLINNNDEIILFQPVFILDNKITKPDAIVINNNSFIVIETKATTKSSFVHFLDLFFQKQVIENCLNDKVFNYSYKLCLIKYEYLDKNEISFVISDYINLKKTVSYDKNKIGLKEIANIKIGNYPEDGDFLKTIWINDLLSFKIDPDEYKAPRSNNPKNIILAYSVMSDFDLVIKELENFKTKMNPIDIPKRFEPHKNDKNTFKNTDMWSELRTFYAHMGLNMFFYSGNVIKQSADNIVKYMTCNKILQKDFFNAGGYYYDVYINNPLNIDVNISKFINCTNNIKANKIYFDFETINPAIRVLNNTLPFAQIITQCSIIKWTENVDLNNLTCNNIIIDPLSMDINSLKSVVDALYCENTDEYSYIVYNKTFEKSRLLELDILINDPIYSKKINSIVKNLFDLLDFLNFSKDSDPAIFIKELGGFKSIKKVLPLIEKYNPSLFKKTKCLDYKKDLVIQNGFICQQKTLMRMNNQLSDLDWCELKNNLALYCENDVRAMIAVELFFKDIYENINHYKQIIKSI